jgi:hypothetical protein
VRGYDFEFGTTVTENARKLVAQAARDIVELIEKL